MKSARLAASCGICGQHTYRCPRAPELARLPTSSSGNQHVPQPSLIFSTLPPMLEPTSMGASSLTLCVAQERTHLEDGFSSPLTSGRFVYTIDIQPTFRGKNLWRIRHNYARIVCAIERSGLGWHAKGKR
jgi:hypothetical protein